MTAKKGKPAAAASPVALPTPGEWGARRADAWQRLCPTVDPGSCAINADHWAELESALETICGHPLFANLLLEKPLPIKKKGPKASADFVDGSHIAPFEAESYVNAMASRGLYTCGGNLLWASVFYTPFPSVPINRQGACRPAQNEPRDGVSFAQEAAMSANSAALRSNTL